MSGTDIGVRGTLTAAFAAVLCTGCLPHVMHGPRVEDDGVSGAISLMLGRNFEIGEGGKTFVPSLYGSVRRSFVPADSTGPAFSIGLQVPFLVAVFLARDGGFRSLGATSYADLYVQPARRLDAGWEYGGGVMLSTALAAPYVQAGKLNAIGSGWYTTQMVAFANDDFDTGVLYLPTAVYRHKDAAENVSAANFSLGGGFGFYEHNTETFLLLGVTLELGLGR